MPSQTKSNRTGNGLYYRLRCHSPKNGVSARLLVTCTQYCSVNNSLSSSVFGNVLVETPILGEWTAIYSMFPVRLFVVHDAMEFNLN